MAKPLAGTRARSPATGSRHLQDRRGPLPVHRDRRLHAVSGLGLYPRRTAANTLLFLGRVLEEMSIPVLRIQTDRGREFFAYKLQHCLVGWGIKFRPIKPGSPHLNGKVERSQKTDFD